MPIDNDVEIPATTCHLPGRLTVPDGSAGVVAFAPATSQFAIGYFGASTGAAAALRACAELPTAVSAVVSRGGRGDLAGAALAHVRAPTLLLVGEFDQQVLDLNRQTMAQLRGPCELRVVPGASHLFEESGALDAVARETTTWFTTHLTVGRSAPG